MERKIPKCKKCKQELEGHAVWKMCLMWFCNNPNCKNYRLYTALTQKDIKEYYINN